VSKILNFPLDKEIVNTSGYVFPHPADTPDPVEDPSALQNIVGTWNGFLYLTPSSTFPWLGMVSMHLRAVGEGLKFTGTFRGSEDGDYIIHGDCHHDPDKGDISVKYTCSATPPSDIPPQYFSGTWDASSGHLTGNWGINEEIEPPYLLVYRRTSPNDLCFLPPPRSFEATRTKALWRFALDAVRHRVRRDMWCWDYFRERRNNRLQFVDLSIRRSHFGKPLSAEEDETFSRLQQRLTPPDIVFYLSLAQRQIQMTTNHKYAFNSTFHLLNANVLSRLPALHVMVAGPG
jgi:hypothetical protein